MDLIHDIDETGTITTIPGTELDDDTEAQLINIHHQNWKKWGESTEHLTFEENNLQKVQEKGEDVMQVEQ